MENAVININKEELNIRSSAQKTFRLPTVTIAFYFGHIIRKIICSYFLYMGVWEYKKREQELDKEFVNGSECAGMGPVHAQPLVSAQL